MRYTFLILDTYLPDIQYLCEQGFEVPWLFLEAKRGPRAKKLGKHSGCLCEANYLFLRCRQSPFVSVQPYSTALTSMCWLTSGYVCQIAHRLYGEVRYVATTN